jgi:hypothetical protein
VKQPVIATIVASCLLAAATSVWAADVKVTGTLSSVQGEHLMVKTDEGKDVMVMLDAKTTITKEKKKVDAKSLKAGDAIVAEGPGDASMITAKTVDAGPPAKK